LAPSRWRNEKRFDPIKAAVERLFDNVYDATRAEHDRLARDANLSALGRQDALRKLVGTVVAPELHLARAQVAAIRKRLEAWRVKLQPSAADESDVAGAVMRSEIRSSLRNMPIGRRLELLLSEQADAIQCSDSELPGNQRPLMK
jgi:CBS-domain-containing membrane protein